MLVYPQLASGALAQFPIVKHRRQRTVVNALADSTTIKLADPDGAVIEWKLTYAALSDSEVAVLQQFFIVAEGSLNGFTFLDPAANLLSRSEQLTDSVWTKDPFLAVAAGVTDPNGSSNGSRISNSGAGPQTIAQTLSAPGGYLYCFSVYAQSSQAATVTLHCGTARIGWKLGTSWNRLSLTGSGDPVSQSIVFGVELPAGAVADIFGLQVEPQPSVSEYKASEAGGVYENANFRDDVFSFTTTGVNRHSAIVNIIHANSL